MADINTTVRRFNKLGVLEIVKGGTTYTLKNIDGASLVIRTGGYTAGEYSDRGVPQTPYLGDGNYTEWEFTAYAGSKVSGQLAYIMNDQANGSDANNVAEFTLKVDIPNPQTPSTGERWSDAYCFVVMPGGVEFLTGGGDRDRVRIRGKTKTPAPQWVAY